MLCLCSVLLKGNPLFTKPFKFFTAHAILLGPKKITSFIVDVINAHNKEEEEFRSDVQALEGRGTLVSSRDETHKRRG